MAITVSEVKVEIDGRLDAAAIEPAAFGVENTLLDSELGAGIVKR